MKSKNQKILTPLVSLDTPGKATVQVVILADPDGHEICFVGDEAFRELSKMDPKGSKLLDDAIAADKSDEWFAKRNKLKASGQQKTSHGTSIYDSCLALVKPDVSIYDSCSYNVVISSTGWDGKDMCSLTFESSEVFQV